MSEPAVQAPVPEQPTEPGAPSGPEFSSPVAGPAPHSGHEFSNPVAYQAAPTPTPRTIALPWVLVAVLSAACIVLATLLTVREGELAGLRRATAAPSAQATTAPAPASAAPTPDEAAIAVMKSLPRRIANDPTALGPVDAPVTLVVWSDFRCPFCAKWANTTLKELRPYVDSGSLRVEARDLVLFGEESTLAAVAARAAGAQGKYWEFHDAIFAAAPASGHPTVTTALVKKYAEQAGVRDVDKFTKDLSSKALADAVKADTDQARQLGISGTPFFVINTTVINGAQPTSEFVAAIESFGGKR